MARDTSPAILLALLVASSCARPSRSVGCRFFPNQEPAACEQASDGGVKLSQASLAVATFGPDGLGAILVDGRGLYFVNRRNRTAPAFPFDNGPDYVVEGLARTVEGGKVGFVDTDLNIVVAPAWDFASPFDDGVAAVCTGCVSEPMGEHRRYAGGKWGYIDRSGKVILPVQYDSEPAARQAMGR